MGAVELKLGNATLELENGAEPRIFKAGSLISLINDLYITFNADGWFTYKGLTTVGKDGQTIKFVCAGRMLATDLIIAAGKYGGDSATVEIALVEKTATDGNVDTYTVTLSNGNTSTFTVTNHSGASIASIEKTATNGLVDTYTITLTDGSTHTFTVTNGKDGLPGADGVGIENIAKTAVNGLVDTYTITLTDGRIFTYNVTNGNTTIIDNTGGSFDITDVVELVLASLPEAEGVAF